MQFDRIGAGPSDLHEAEKRAGAGDAHALMEMGAAYRDGTGTRKDLRKARKLFGESADRGEHLALVCLGDMEIEDGKESRAVEHYLRASCFRVPEAEQRLTVLYTEKGDSAAALDHAERGAVLGVPECMLCLGRSYYTGTGAEEDHMHALYWFSRCCRSFPEAMRCVGLIRMERDTPYFDMFKGLAALRLAADSRDETARKKLLELRLDAETEGLPDDYFDPPEIPQYTDSIIERMDRDVPDTQNANRGILSRVLGR